MTQGTRIKEIRNTLGMTLEKFGEKLGVTKTAISNIEKGNRNLTEQMAKAICREYNVNYDFLMYGEGEMFSNLPQTILDELCAQYNLNDFDKSIIQMYISFPEEHRQQIKKYMYSHIKNLNSNDDK